MTVVRHSILVDMIRRILFAPAHRVLVSGASPKGPRGQLAKAVPSSDSVVADGASTEAAWFRR